MTQAGDDNRDERIAVLERENVGRRIYDRLTALETGRERDIQRLDDHDKVLVDIRNHLKSLAASVGAWDKRFYLLIGVLAAGSPTGQQLLSSLF